MPAGAVRAAHPRAAAARLEGKAGRFDKGDFIPPPKALSLEDRIAGTNGSAVGTGETKAGAPG